MRSIDPCWFAHCETRFFPSNVNQMWAFVSDIIAASPRQSPHQCFWRLYEFNRNCVPNRGFCTAAKQKVDINHLVPRHREHIAQRYKTMGYMYDCALLPMLSFEFWLRYDVELLVFNTIVANVQTQNAYEDPKLSFQILYNAPSWLPGHRALLAWQIMFP